MSLVGPHVVGEGHPAGAPPSHAAAELARLRHRRARVAWNDWRQVQYGEYPAPNQPLNILYEISSSDRGQRIQMSKQYSGTYDKLDTMLELAGETGRMCRLGHNVTLAITAAWNVSAFADRFATATQCDGGFVHVLFRDHYRYGTCANGVVNCAGLLGSRHRSWMGELLQQPTAHGEYIDFVVHTEDDVFVSINQVEGYLEHMQRLRNAGLSESEGGYMIGFLRYEVNKTEPGDKRYVWEVSRSLEQARLVTLATDGTLYIDFGGDIGTHQAMWMGTRAQVLHWDEVCSHGFLQPREHPAPTWVEFWSGFLQMYSGDCTGGRKVHKLVPVHDMDQFLIHHMANNKLGSGTRPDLAVLFRRPGELVDAALQLSGERWKWQRIGQATPQCPPANTTANGVRED